jgi:hypothetical protein
MSRYFRRSYWDKPYWEKPYEFCYPRRPVRREEPIVWPDPVPLDEHIRLGKIAEGRSNESPLNERGE